MTAINFKQLDIRLYAVIASLLISAIVFLFPYAHTPNNDAYIYIRTADIFLNDGLAAAFRHYSWASYAILIGLTSKLGLELFTAAHLINSLFYALLVFSFISIVREINTSRLMLLLAAIVILVYPQLNEYRYYVIRDTGFWALSLLALWQLLLYARTGTWKYATGFCGALILATALRPEALFYLCITPFALLFDQRWERRECRRRFLLLAGLVLGAGLITLLGLVLSGANPLLLLTEFVSVYKPFITNTFTPDVAQATAIGTVLFGEHASAYSQEYIAMFMAAGLLTILIANLFNGIGGPYLLVLIYGSVQKQLKIPRAVAVPVLFFMLTNALVLLGFLFITRYLTSRYAILFSLMLILLVPQLIAYYLQNKSETKRRTATLAVVIFLAYCTFDAYISFGDSKRYVYDSIEWVADNNEADAALLTNNRAIAYFTGKVQDYDGELRDLTAAEILGTAPGDLLVMEMTYLMTELLATANVAAALERVAVFPSAENARVSIYRRVNR